jgi:LmbE family N-acetylglucosaminyl deacetylase
MAPRTPTSIKLDLGVLQEMKRRAIEAHDTQSVMSRAAEVYEKYGHEERYLLASARHPQRFEHETDIFFGIEET